MHLQDCSFSLEKAHLKPCSYYRGTWWQKMMGVATLLFVLMQDGRINVSIMAWIFFKFLQVFLSKARDKMFSLPFYSNVQICLRNRSSSEQASSMDIRTVIQLCDFDVNEYGGWMDTRSILGQQMHMAIAWKEKNKLIFNAFRAQAWRQWVSLTNNCTQAFIYEKKNHLSQNSQCIWTQICSYLNSKAN